MSHLLKQKTKVMAARQSHKTYEAFDFGKRSKDCDGNTPLHFAVENGHNDIFDLIVDSITPWVFRALK